MKKITALLALVFTAAALLSGCSQKTDSYAMTADAPEELPAGIVEAYGNPPYMSEPFSTVNEDGFPIYKEDDLIFTSAEYFLGVDYSQLKGSGVGYDCTSHILGLFPKQEFRLREDGMIYYMCDLDTGYRLIRFAPGEYDYQFTRGYTLVIAEEHSHSDFKRLKIGDPIQEVIKIDEAASLSYRQWMNDKFTGAERKYMVFNAWIDKGWPYSTVHYLSDGLLKIEYRMLGDDQTIYITNIVFSKDRTLTDTEGTTINYTIDERDLPY